MKKENLEKIKENTKALRMILQGITILNKNAVSKRLRLYLLGFMNLFQKLIFFSVENILIAKDKDEFNGIVENVKKELEENEKD